MAQAKKSKAAAKKSKKPSSSSKPAKKTAKKAAKKKSSRSSAEVVELPRRGLAKSYSPQEFEGDLYRFWEKNGCFDSSNESAPGQESFSMVVPPPNVTGVLHMGHALTFTIQDILVRWRRMSGDNTVWLPGTDHAGIATQTQVEKAIAKEGREKNGKPLTRHDLGREAFVDRVWEWKEEHGGRISGQLRRIGASLDWKRERFTLDDGLSKAVREVFVRLHEEGLIYRGERIINWCVPLQTALSDLEVIPKEKKGNLWHIRYRVLNENGDPVQDADGNDRFIVVATTRPETLLGDTAVCVHPEDERYQDFHGCQVELPLLKRKIPIICDTYVDREFGSGALKITPAHDFNDYEIGKRHQLPFVSVMGKDGRITSAGGPYAGMLFKDARERLTQDLSEASLLEKTEEHIHQVGHCQRTGSVVEPIVSKQWFVKIQPLAEPAIEAVKNESIQFVPQSWSKTYFEWMYNIRDWCISRQLWWGHRIPAWHCSRCQGITVAREAPKKCSCGAGASELRQDEDVLDTWFSSALWPFSTFGWPSKTKALETFYPTNVMETGFDIIFFWVARMIMMGIHFMGDVPFEKVYLHAMVRDEKGEKMSKSKGNVVDPVDLMNELGADPLRFTLASMAGQGRDVKLSPARVEGYRAFCNKLWNAVKFFHLQLDPKNGEAVFGPKGPVEGVERWIEKQWVELLPVHRWIVSRLQRVAGETERGLKDFELDASAKALYEFAWHEFCDWFIELSKLSLKGNVEERTQTLVVLHYVIERLMALLHPFMPFVTEELWQSLPWRKPATSPLRESKGEPPISTLMLQEFPSANLRLIDSEAEHSVEAVQTIIEAIRNFRGENRVQPKVKFAVRYRATTSAAEAFVRLHGAEIEALAGVDKIVAVEPDDPVGEFDTVIPVSNPPLELRISLKGLVDVQAERKRVAKEMEKVQGDLEHVRNKLSKETFVKKAPPELVAKTRGMEKDLLAKLEELDGALKRLTEMSL